MTDIGTAANIAEIAGGLAILVSLAYVGYQIRQSNRIASAAALQSVLDAFSERQLRQYLEHPEVLPILVRGHHSKDNLPRGEWSVFTTCINREIFQMQHVHQLRGHKLISEQEYQIWMAYTVSHIKTPGGKATWEMMKAVYNPIIVDCIEEYMEENPVVPSLIELFPYEYGDDAYREHSERTASSLAVR